MPVPSCTGLLNCSLTHPTLKARLNIRLAPSIGIAVLPLRTTSCSPLQAKPRQLCSAPSSLCGREGKPTARITATFIYSPASSSPRQTSWSHLPSVVGFKRSAQGASTKQPKRGFMTKKKEGTKNSELIPAWTSQRKESSRSHCGLGAGTCSSGPSSDVAAERGGEGERRRWPTSREQHLQESSSRRRVGQRRTRHRWQKLHLRCTT